MKWLIVGSIIFWLSSAQAWSGPVVVELFTSQGCSSCPPADELLGTLAKDPSILALTEPVDYWDYLGWKDTLASPLFTKRQRDYAAGRGSASVYTPEMIIEGSRDVIGSRRSEVLAAIEAAKTLPMVSVSLLHAPGGLKAEIGAGPAAVATIWMVTFQRAVSVAIGRGENSGRRIDYSNVVRAIDPV